MTNCRRLGRGCAVQEEGAASNEDVHFSLPLSHSLALFLACYVNSLDGWSARSNLSVDTKRSRTHTNTDTAAADTSTNKHTNTLHYTNKRTHSLADNENKHSHLHFLNSSEFSASSFFEISIFLALAQIVVFFFLWSISIIFPRVNFPPPTDYIYIYIEHTHGALVVVVARDASQEFCESGDAMQVTWFPKRRINLYTIHVRTPLYDIVQI